MNLVPQVETTEMSDADLDSIAGGQGGGGTGAVVDAGAAGAAGLYVEAGPLCVGAGAGVAVSPAGVAADVHAHAGLH
ncbi:hypothetical protein AB0K80_04340 [Streptomyces sp. NPDC052682]|uniref:hypothetical protein n=1 Tax=Streptomyces sp. NPDC052682 TaxID=3154954 RepID=UPI0034280A5C